MLSVHYQDGSILADAVEEAKTFAARSKGLLGRRSLLNNEGMLFRNCKSIHMFGMHIALDVIFLDKRDRVVKVYRKLKPWRMATGGPDAKHVIELAAGTLPENRPALGEQLQISDPA